MIVVYKLTNIITSDFYIGSTNNYRNRQKQHLYNLRNNKNINRRLQSSFNKYGEINFEFSIIEELVDISVQKEREQYWIDLLNPQFNHVRDVNSIYYPITTEETRKKISAANTGKKRPQHVIDAIAEMHRGMKRSDETRKKISEATAGKRKGVSKPLLNIPIVSIDVLTQEQKEYASIKEAKNQAGSILHVLYKKCLFRKGTTLTFFYKDELQGVDIKQLISELRKKPINKKCPFSIDDALFIKSNKEKGLRFITDYFNGKFNKERVKHFLYSKLKWLPEELLQTIQANTVQGK